MGVTLMLILVFFKVGVKRGYPTVRLIPVRSMMLRGARGVSHSCWCWCVFQGGAGGKGCVGEEEVGWGGARGGILRRSSHGPVSACPHPLPRACHLPPMSAVALPQLPYSPNLCQQRLCLSCPASPVQEAHRLWAPLKRIRPFGALFVCIVSLCAVYIGDIDEKGVKIIGNIPAGGWREAGAVLEHSE